MPDPNPDPPPAPEHLKPGPFAIPGRDWFLSSMLAALFSMKIILGPGWWLYLIAGVAGMQLIPLLAGWLAWRWSGERPFYAEMGFLGAAAAMFVGLSLPVYGVMLEASQDLPI